MKVWPQLDDFSCEGRTIVSIGNFDGVHRGHARLATALRERGRHDGLETVVVTFEPHTRTALSPTHPQPILSTFEEKAVLFEHLGIDHLVRLPFDHHLRAMTAAQFVEQVIGRRLRAAVWVMGQGHTFGSDRIGVGISLHELLSRNDIWELPLSLLSDGTEVVSSTGIRGCVASGDMARAVSMLGHPYLVAARRVGGLGLGTKLGYPTLNFSRPSVDKVIPPAGVYAAKLECDGGSVSGALYFGTCPTFEAREAHFEMHLLEPVTKVTELGQTGRLWVHKYIRPDRVFSDAALLVEQITKDVNAIRAFFREGEGVCL